MKNPNAVAGAHRPEAHGEENKLIVRCYITATPEQLRDPAVLTDRVRSMTKCLRDLVRHYNAEVTP